MRAICCAMNAARHCSSYTPARRRITAGIGPLSRLIRASVVDLGLRVRPFRVDRPALVDPLPPRAGRVHQQRAREHELPDLVGPQLAQQPPRALDGDRLVLRIGLPREVVVGGEVDHRRDRRAAGAPGHLRQRRPHAVVGGQVDPHRRHAPHRPFRLGEVQPDHAVALGQSRRQRLPDETAAAGDQDAVPAFRHRSTSLRRVAKAWCWRELTAPGLNDDQDAAEHGNVGPPLAPSAAAETQGGAAGRSPGLPCAISPCRSWPGGRSSR